MRFALLLLLAGCVGGCSLSVGAGAAARVGRRPGQAGVDCDGFESCDRVYRAALARARQCQAEDGDCEREQADVLDSYELLRERALGELEALRAENAQAARQIEAARMEERNRCARPAKAPDSGPPPPPGPRPAEDGWFDGAAPASK
jgi:hypothetical protein